MHQTDFNYRAIGIIHSPYQDIEGMPIQPTGAKGTRGSIEVFTQYLEGLKDLEGFSHIIILYHFHLIKESQMTVIPFLDTQPRGVFATRAPKRPNPIGLSILRLLQINDNLLKVEDLDVLDGTPLLDIKPYVPEFDNVGAAKVGWLEKAKGEVKDKFSDDRFR